jgi:hypothetical protein
MSNPLGFFGKPKRAVRPDAEIPGLAAGRRQRILGNRSIGGDAPDAVSFLLRKPECVIRPRLDPNGVLSALGREYSVTTLAVVMRPILFPTHSVNQSAPSGPVVILKGWLLEVGMTYSVKDCAGDLPGRHNTSAAIHASGKIRGG